MDKLELESLNNALLREGFKPFSANAFAGISRVVVHSITAKIYEIIGSHEMINRTLKDAQSRNTQQQARIDTLIKELEDVITFKTVLENKVLEQEKIIQQGTPQSSSKEQLQHAPVSKQFWTWITGWKGRDQWRWKVL